MASVAALSLLAAVFPIALAVPAAAIPLPPDTNAEPSGASPPPGAIIDSGSFLFEIPGGEGSPGTATGSVGYEVIQEATDQLRFEFVVTNDPGSDFDVAEFATSSHEGYTVDADVDAASPGDAAPGSVSRNHTGGPRVSFFFGDDMAPGIQPGESSQTLYVRSNAMGYDEDGTIRLGRGGNARVDIPGVGPQPVPEPGAPASALAACLALAAVRGGRVRFRGTP